MGDILPNWVAGLSHPACCEWRTVPASERNPVQHSAPATDRKEADLGTGLSGNDPSRVAAEGLTFNHCELTMLRGFLRQNPDAYGAEYPAEKLGSALQVGSGRQGLIRRACCTGAKMQAVCTEAVVLTGSPI